VIELTIYLGQYRLSVTFGVSRHPKFNPDKLAISKDMCVQLMFVRLSPVQQRLIIGWACLVPMVQDCFITTVCLKRGVLPNGHEITGNW
jgi:hypothetical protein